MRHAHAAVRSLPRTILSQCREHGLIPGGALVKALSCVCHPPCLCLCSRLLFFLGCSNKLCWVKQRYGRCRLHAIAPGDLALLRLQQHSTRCNQCIAATLVHCAYMPACTQQQTGPYQECVPCIHCHSTRPKTHLCCCRCSADKTASVAWCLGLQLHCRGVTGENIVQLQGCSCAAQGAVSSADCECPCSTYKSTWKDDRQHRPDHASCCTRAMLHAMLLKMDGCKCAMGRALYALIALPGQTADTLTS